MIQLAGHVFPSSICTSHPLLSVSSLSFSLSLSLIAPEEASLSNKQSTVSEHSHRARPPLRSARGTANPLPRRPPSSFPSSVSASQSLLFPTESPCTQPFNASSTMLISSSIVTALEASLRPYDRRSPSRRSFPRSKNDEPKPFSRSGCESRSRRLCIPSARQRETYGRDEGLWTAMKQKKKANVHSAD